MLLERASSLAKKIGRYQKLKAAANEADLVRTRADQVGQAAVLIAQAREALTRFSSAGVSIDYFPANVAELSEKAKTLRTIATESPVGLANPPFNVTHEFTLRLRGLAVAADDAIRQGWNRFVVENAPRGSDEVLDALGKLPQLRAGVSRIRQCGQKIAGLAASPPADPARAVIQLRELVTEYRAAWTELTADNLPNAVILFLRACAGDGAPVTALTNEVRDWLEMRDLIGSLRIRIG